MGHNKAEPSVVAKGKAAPPADDNEKERRILLQEKLACVRLKLQSTLAMSADLDEELRKLKATASRVATERDEAASNYYALLAELQARRNSQVMMAPLASGPPAASSCYGTRAPVQLGGMTMQEQQHYAQAAGVSYCYESSASSTHSFDLNMLPVDAAEGDSVGPGTAMGSGAPSMAVKKKRSGGSRGGGSSLDDMVSSAGKKKKHGDAS